jgi:hypothetical protein
MRAVHPRVEPEPVRSRYGLRKADMGAAFSARKSLATAGAGTAKYLNYLYFPNCEKRLPLLAVDAL